MLTQFWTAKYTARGQPTHGFKIRHLGFARATVKQRCVGCHYMPILGEATHPSFKVQLANTRADEASERMLKKRAI